MKKWYYVFIGVRATTGEPHPTTGRFSQYGYCVKFASKALRDEYMLYGVLEYVKNDYGRFVGIYES